MEFINPFVRFSPNKTSGNVTDDWVDRLNHIWSVALFVLFVIVVASKQYVGDPIHCWCPAQFPSQYVEYTKKICWVSNTYYVPMTDVIPKSDILKPHLSYYQWTHFILIFEALLFAIPYLLWKSLNNRSGMYVGNIISAARVYAEANKFDERGKMVRYVTRHMDRYMELRVKLAARLKHSTCGRFRLFCKQACCLIGRRYGNYMIGLYLMCKVLYCLNTIGQLFLLNGFLGSKFHFYGLDMIRMLFKGDRPPESDVFPRVTLCDFYVREIAKPHRYTVQCVLQINLFNEAIFAFVWWWLALMSVINTMSLVAWLSKSVIGTGRMAYVKENLKIHQPLKSREDKILLKEFVYKYLKDDGVFTLRLVSANCSDIVVSEILNVLWENFKQYQVIRLNEKKPFALE